MARIAALSAVGSLDHEVTTRDRSGQTATFVRESIRESLPESSIFSGILLGFESPSLRHLTFRDRQ